MTLILMIAVMFIVCMVLCKPGFKFFLFWLAVCAAVFFLVHPSVGVWGFLCYFIVIGADSKESGTKTSRSVPIRDSDDELPDYVIYGNGDYKVKNLSNTGYYHSKGGESVIGMFNKEYRDNGEVVMDNAYIPGRRDIYKNNVCIGYEYADSFGFVHRVDYQ